MTSCTRVSVLGQLTVVRCFVVNWLNAPSWDGPVQTAAVEAAAFGVILSTKLKIDYFWEKYKSGP